jgi:toxin ParE1/3/4
VPVTEYRLTEAAEEDLIGIWQWTVDRWGIAQADRYHAALEACCERLAQRRVQGRPVEGFEAILLHRCERHVIFYTMEASDRLIVLAILHKRMDLPAHLLDRLKEE